MRAKIGLAAAGSALSLTACGTLPASSSAASSDTASARGWRVLKTASWLAVDPEVVATGPNEAWAFGGRGRTDRTRWPSAARWDGKKWRDVALPLGREGAIAAASASARTNVWAVTRGGKSPAVVRWNGRKWQVTGRLGSMTITDMVALGPKDVWVFGTARSPQSGVTWHYNGRGWRRVPTPFAVFQAGARSATDIWAVGMGRGGRQMVGRYDGRRWRTVESGVPRVRGTFNSVTATPNGVWITVDPALAEGPGAGASLLSFDGRKWRFQKMGKTVGYWAENSAPVPDGKGGMWFLGTTEPGVLKARLVHRSASGKWTIHPVRVKGYDELELGTLARLPGTSQLLAAGRAYGRAETGAIVSYR
ncbi:hypothetical protein [Actinomadura rudentiformis]|uniref:Uncharacterized protein n=1 Tax=Actinomadura rudentiformis TaxID=359158 RepID=A0A6H9YHE7_9ACTN|nr:hypothetical protein [Actinomadura rudentiformis]KAB2343375.1 hypothetical protein F8566_35165 [Actinomadura rudentiformis]